MATKPKRTVNPFAGSQTGFGGFAGGNPDGFKSLLLHPRLINTPEGQAFQKEKAAEKAAAAGVKAQADARRVTAELKTGKKKPKTGAPSKKAGKVTRPILGAVASRGGASFLG